MISDIEMVYRYIRDATADLSEIIDDSDFVEYKLIRIKRKLLKANYHFTGQYMEYLAERANIDIDAESAEYLEKHRGD